MAGKVADSDYVTIGRSRDGSFPSSLIAGISTFLGAEVVPPVREQLEARDVRAAVLGMPWEGTSTCRPGTSYGPRAIRRATELYMSYHGEYKVDLIDALNLVDCGDVSIVPGNPARTFERAERCISEIYAAGALPIVLGGDDSCPIAVSSAISKMIDGPMGYVQLDAHMDTAEDVAGEVINHACGVSRAAELPNVDPKNVVVAGLNGPLNPSSERDYIDRTGITPISVWEMEEWGIERSAERILEIAWNGTKGVVLHTDLDVIDQAFVPGVSVPEVGGMTAREVIKLVRLLVAEGIDAYVVAECSPVYDPSNNAARVAARLVMDSLGVRANPSASGRVY